MSDFTEVQSALGEWAFAMRAQSYGASGYNDVVAHALRNLPVPELDGLRPHIEAAIAAAVARTTARLAALGLEPGKDPRLLVQPSPNAEPHCFRPSKEAAL